MFYSWHFTHYKLKGTVVNQALPSLHGGSRKITRTLPLSKFFTKLTIFPSQRHLCILQKNQYKSCKRHYNRGKYFLVKYSFLSPLPLQFLKINSNPGWPTLFRKISTKIRAFSEKNPYNLYIIKYPYCKVFFCGTPCISGTYSPMNSEHILQWIRNIFS